MFESSEFLDLFLPEYFWKVVLKSNQSSSLANPGLQWLNIISQFINFTSNIHRSLHLENNLFLFLIKQFPFLQLPLEWRSVTSKSKFCQEKSKIMEYLEQKLDKIEMACIQLYLKIIHISAIVEGNQISSEQQSQYGKQILKFCKETRLKYEISRFDMCDCKDYDDYMFQLFEVILKNQISPNMHNIYKLVIQNQFSNLSDKIIHTIQSSISAQSRKNPPQIKTYQNNQNNFQTAFGRIHENKTKKFEKVKITPTKKSIISPRKLDKSPEIRSQTRPLSTKQNLFCSPNKRIQKFAKLNKQRIISKERTIYFGRKNLHLPKLNWLQNTGTFLSQSTLPSFEKDRKSENTEDKSFRFDNEVSMFDQNQNVLVRSTPKASKKVAMRIISQKLDF